MSPLFLGSHPAVDFLNTRLAPQGEWVELIGDGDAFAEWLVAARLLDASAALRLRRKFNASALDLIAARARKLREWARDWLGRWRQEPGADYGNELRRLNGLLSLGSYQPEVSVAEGGWQFVQRPRLETADDLIALVAASLASLLVNEEPALLKHCAGAGCTLWFLDRTKAHRRLFCSADACGNRAKVAAFRERQRNG